MREQQHWDHIQGLPFFLPVYVPGSRIAVVGRRTAEMALEDALEVADGAHDPTAMASAIATASAAAPCRARIISAPGPCRCCPA